MYYFVKVLFGVRPTGSAFIRALNSLFSSTDRKFIKSFVDDSYVKSKNFNEHMVHLRIFLNKVKNTGLTLRFDKTLFCLKEIPFLGFILSAQRIRQQF